MPKDEQTLRDATGAEGEETAEKRLEAEALATMGRHGMGLRPGTVAREQDQEDEALKAILSTRCGRLGPVLEQTTNIQPV